MSSSIHSMTLGRRGRIENDAGPWRPRLADLAQGAVQVRTRLGMHQQMIGAGVPERLEVRIGRGDHQMDVDGNGDVRTQRLHHHGADRDVGNEMAVHDVDVQPVGAGGLDRLGLFAQAREVGGQHGRRDQGPGGVIGSRHSTPHPGDEEPVETAGEVVWQDTQPSFGCEACRRANRPRPASSDRSRSPVSGKEAAHLRLALLGLERTDAIDQAPARRRPARRPRPAALPAPRPGRRYLAGRTFHKASGWRRKVPVAEHGASSRTRVEGARIAPRRGVRGDDLGGLSPGARQTRAVTRRSRSAERSTRGDLRARREANWNVLPPGAAHRSRAVWSGRECPAGEPGWPPPRPEPTSDPAHILPRRRRPRAWRCATFRPASIRLLARAPARRRARRAASGPRPVPRRSGPRSLARTRLAIGRAPAREQPWTAREISGSSLGGPSRSRPRSTALTSPRKGFGARLTVVSTAAKRRRVEVEGLGHAQAQQVARGLGRFPFKARVERAVDRSKMAKRRHRRRRARRPRSWSDNSRLAGAAPRALLQPGAAAERAFEQLQRGGAGDQVGAFKGVHPPRLPR